MGQWPEFETALAEFERVVAIFKEQEDLYLRAKQALHAHEEAYHKIKSEIIDRALALDIAEGRTYGKAFGVYAKAFGAKSAKEMWEFLINFVRIGQKPSPGWRVRKPKEPITYNN